MASTRCEDRGSEHWILLEGELDHEGCEEIRQSFQAAAAHQSGHVVVDLKDVSFVSSQGIWMLIQAHKKLKERGGQMLLHGVQPHVHKVFDTVGIFRAIPEWGKPA